MKDKFINFRATEKEKKQLAILAKRAKLSQADFIRHSVFNKQIVVIDGVKPLQKELKRIGNNLNQLTTRSNMGHFSVVDLQSTKDELRKIYERLAELCATKDGQVRPEIGLTYDEETPIEIVAPVEKPTEICHEKSEVDDFDLFRSVRRNSIFSRKVGD